MPNMIDVTYAQTGKSTKTNQYGMREMQERAFQARDAQYLLLKAPPASGKSRALMFIALDKLYKQGLQKVIVAVPERSIGSSFRTTRLSEQGFFADWDYDPHYNLCTPGLEGSKSKVNAFIEFLTKENPSEKERVLICTHATLRFAFDAAEESFFNNTLLAIDDCRKAGVQMCCKLVVGSKPN